MILPVCCSSLVFSRYMAGSAVRILETPGPHALGSVVGSFMSYTEIPHRNLWWEPEMWQITSASHRP